ncbi:MAG: transcription elongation factor GreA [Candidatus Omnitrophica bacterium]|nr:transcription elongation factor GreA [Candidatus Omnitrophota bacterium]MBI3021003.1 transcription elongation factor GreA [Candidatus Omnitrophota bacterium]MBI3082865.1 transcription elongation factor GreA [Candidatus Omnitrophota bacterium]
MSDTYLTKEGLAKLHAEHASLLQQKRQLTEEVSQAAAMGDLRENSEYHAARERLQHVAKRLAELDAKLAHVRIIDELEVKSGEARVGTQVTLLDEQTKERFTYFLVGSDEADPQNGKLSISSPLGKSLLGKKPGESFTLTLPKTVVPYRLIEVTRASG